MTKQKDIELVNVTKVYGKTVAVNDVSLAVTRGEFLTLLGPSGCGKTTALRIIAGFIQPTHGAIYIKGELMTDIPPYRRNTGMVFQNYALFPHMTAFDNIAFGLRMRRTPENEIKSRVQESFELIGLTGYENRYPRQLSGGEQQRVALARALVIEPSVLLLDEPLSNLDLKLRQKMRLEIKRIQEKTKITTIYVTHDQEEALVMSDRLALMNKGRIMQTGSPSDIYEFPRNKFVADFIGQTNFLAGKVVSMNESKVSIQLDNGLSLEASRSVIDHHSTKITEQLNVAVSIRPQKVKIVKGQPSKDLRNTFAGRVEDVEYVGSRVKYHINLFDGMGIVAEEVLFGSPNYRVEDQVFIILPPEDCLLVSTD